MCDIVYVSGEGSFCCCVIGVGMVEADDCFCFSQVCDLIECYAFWCECY